MEKIELTRKEWEDLKAYVEFRGREKKPCHSCPMCRACSCLVVATNKCEELKAWIKKGDELYSKVSRFIDSPELASLIKVMLDRIQREESVKYLKELLHHTEIKMYRLMSSETSLFNERIIFKE